MSFIAIARGLSAASSLFKALDRFVSVYSDEYEWMFNKKKDIYTFGPTFENGEVALNVLNILKARTMANGWVSETEFTNLCIDFGCTDGSFNYGLFTGWSNINSSNSFVKMTRPGGKEVYTIVLPKPTKKRSKVWAW